MKPWLAPKSLVDAPTRGPGTLRSSPWTTRVAPTSRNQGEPKK